MIISTAKPPQELLTLLEGSQRIALVGCSECATTCRTGGADDLEAMKSFLEENGKTVTATLVASISCNRMLVKKELKGIREALESSDAILSMSCGDGVQTVAGNTSLPVYPANNTMFLGEVERVGVFSEACRFCGDCVLGETGAICPVTKCAKSLTNGPCGGAKEGMCEVNPENRCAWIMIYERLKELGQLDRLYASRPDKVHGQNNWPRTISLRGGEK